MINIGIAILGAGHVSAHLLTSSLLRQKVLGKSLFNVVAVWDNDHRRADEFIVSFNLPSTIFCFREDDALTCADVVVAAICGASPASQPVLASKAIHAGKHVLLAPGYPLAVDYKAAMQLIEARAAYPSLICAVASGMHYLPAFHRLREELLIRQVDSKNIKCISLSAVCSPALLFAENDWQNCSASGGGALSQIGAPLLDAALELIATSQVDDHNRFASSTIVTVQGRSAQLLDDSIDYFHNSTRLWPRTAEDACWVQIDVKRRQENSDRRLVLSQSCVSLDIIASQTVNGFDPELNIGVFVGSSLRLKTDGHSVWVQSNNSEGCSNTVEEVNNAPLFSTEWDETDGKWRSLLSESIKCFADLIVSELILSATSSNEIDSAILFSKVLHNLSETKKVIDVSVALSTQKLIDCIRHSLLGSAVSIEPTKDVNSFLWSHYL